MQELKCIAQCLYTYINSQYACVQRLTLKETRQQISTNLSYQNNKLVREMVINKIISKHISNRQLLDGSNSRQIQRFKSRQIQGFKSIISQWVEERFLQFINKQYYQVQTQISKTQIQRQQSKQCDNRQQPKGNNKQQLKGNSRQQLEGKRSKLRRQLLSLYQKQITQGYKQQKGNNLIERSDQYKSNINKIDINEGSKQSVYKGSKQSVALDKDSIQVRVRNFTYNNYKERDIDIDIERDKQYQNGQEQMRNNNEDKLSSNMSRVEIGSRRLGMSTIGVVDGTIHHDVDEYNRVNTMMVLANPSVSFIESKSLQLQQGQNILQSKHVQHRRCGCVIVSTADIQTVLSTIIYKYFLQYQQSSTLTEQQQRGQFIYPSPNNIDITHNNNNNLTVITTKDIYQHYVHIILFIKLLKQFLSQLIHNTLLLTSHNYSNKSSCICLSLQYIQSQYAQFTQLNKHCMYNKLNHLLNCGHQLYIVKPQTQINLFNICNINNIDYISNKNNPQNVYNLNVILKQHNLFMHPSYDVQIYHNQSNLIALIQSQSLQNVANLYYSYKKGMIDQTVYLNTVKRLQQKQTLIQSNPASIIFKFNSSKYKQSQSLQRVNMNIKSIPVENKSIPVENKSLSIETRTLTINIKPQQLLTKPYMIKKTSLLTKTNTNMNMNNNNSNRTNSTPIKQNNNTTSIRLFNDKINSIPSQMKNTVFNVMRGVQLLSLLTDVDIRELINGSQLMELQNKQVLHNNSMRMHSIYVIIKGKLIIVSNNELNRGQQVITQGNVFGWHYFLEQYHRQQQSINLQNNNNNNNKVIDIDINKNEHFNKYSQFKQSRCSQFKQIRCNVSVCSDRCYVLRIPYNHIEFTLKDKLLSITYSYLFSQPTNIKCNNKKIMQFILQVLHVNYNIHNNNKKRQHFCYQEQNRKYLFNLIQQSNKLQYLEQLQHSLQSSTYQSQIHSLNLFTQPSILTLFKKYPLSIVLF